MRTDTGTGRGYQPIGSIPMRILQKDRSNQQAEREEDRKGNLRNRRKPQFYSPTIVDIESVAKEN
jgi:hypothetical protein